MSPSPLSLAATVTYHRIILISCGKTPPARSSPEFARTFLHFGIHLRPTFLAPVTRRRRGKKEPWRVTPTSGDVTGVGWPVTTLLQPPSTPTLDSLHDPARVAVESVGFPGFQGGGQSILHAQNPNGSCSFVEFYGER